MAKLVKIAETKDLTPGQAAAFDVEGQKIALFNAEGISMLLATPALIAAGPSRKGR
jgi:hypothetical protein